MAGLPVQSLTKAFLAPSRLRLGAATFSVGFWGFWGWAIARLHRRCGWSDPRLAPHDYFGVGWGGEVESAQLKCPDKEAEERQKILVDLVQF